MECLMKSGVSMERSHKNSMFQPYGRLTCLNTTKRATSREINFIDLSQHGFARIGVIEYRSPGHCH